LIESLEIDRRNKSLEAWIGPQIIVEQGDVQILFEELSRVQFLEGENTIYVNDIVVVVDSSNSFVLNWQYCGIQHILMSDNNVFLQLLLQQVIVHDLA